MRVNAFVQRCLRLVRHTENTCSKFTF